MHESYKPGNLLELTLVDGTTVVLGSVIESEWKCLTYFFSAKLPDGSFAAFDVRRPGAEKAARRAVVRAASENQSQSRPALAAG